MTQESKIKYSPGDYGKKRLSAADWAEMNIKNWSRTSEKSAKKQPKNGIFPCICFSRQIGVGALKIADLLAERMPLRVVDREIIEFMAKEKDLTQKAVEYFDERYPGIMSELFTMLTSEKTYLKSDYARQLAKTVTTLAGMDSTIFVGRGAHLILPRENVLAVRFIAGKEYRISRLAGLLGISWEQAEGRIKTMDKEQKAFFKSVYQKDEASPDEFDLVINLRHLKDASQAVEIVACAFEQKFGAIA
nr:cytidylate kinase-like family protein [uncultured Desulfobacter sp.]